MSHIRNFMSQIRDFLVSYPVLFDLVLLLLLAGLLASGFGLEFVNKPAFLFGVVAYLLSVVGFVALGRRQGHWPALTQAGISVALGLAIGIAFYTYEAMQPPPSNNAVQLPTKIELDCTVVNSAPVKKAPKPSVQKLTCEVRTGTAAMAVPPTAAPEKINPFEGINALSAVLAVALALLTLVAQKSASEARVEAEKAQQMLLGAWDVRLSGVLGRLAMETQRQRQGVLEQTEQFTSLESILPDQAHLHRRWAELLSPLSDLLIDMLHAIEEGQTGDLDEQCGRLQVCANSLYAKHQELVTPESVALLREQSRRYITPLRYLLRRAIDLLGDIDSANLSAENSRALRATLRQLDSILRMLD